MSKLTDRLNSAKANKPNVPSGPLWKGPEKDGVTFSLLSRFLTCRERFRITVVEGLKPARVFNRRTAYGDMWHLCEEKYAHWLRKLVGEGQDGVMALVHQELLGHCTDLCKQYPHSQDEVMKWWNVCRTQFPIYVEYWCKHPDSRERQPLMQEEVFDIPYPLPSGRTVRLRGKIDGVDLIGKTREIKAGKPGTGIYIQENKTKGDIDPLTLQRQLKFDLQTMMYMTMFSVWQDLDDYGIPVRTPDATTFPLRGVRYNVVRRPLSGGRGTIVPHKPSKSNPRGETMDAFYERLAQYFIQDPEYYFMRWKTEIMPEEVMTFRRKCLDPILESLCQWWDWISDYLVDPAQATSVFAFRGGQPNSMHWTHPFGVFNTLDEGGSHDLDEYIETGSTVGLERVDNLFPEL